MFYPAVRGSRRLGAANPSNQNCKYQKSSCLLIDYAPEIRTYMRNIRMASSVKRVIVRGHALIATLINSVLRPTSLCSCPVGSISVSPLRI